MDEHDAIWRGLAVAAVLALLGWIGLFVAVIVI